jgi:hypothetical protein
LEHQSAHTCDFTKPAPAHFGCVDALVDIGLKILRTQQTVVQLLLPFDRLVRQKLETIVIDGDAERGRLGACNAPGQQRGQSAVH